MLLKQELSERGYKNSLWQFLDMIQKLQQTIQDIVFYSIIINFQVNVIQTDSSQDKSEELICNAINIGSR